MPGSMTDQTIQALRRLEEIVLEALRKHGISRHALGEQYLDGVSSKTVRRKLVPDRPEGEVPPDVTLCFQALEVCGVDGMEVLSSLCPARTPEVLLSIMPIPGFDRAEERRAERTKGYQRRRRLLQAAEKLEGWIPRDDPTAKEIWPVRHSDPELGPVYEELERLDEMRHRDRDAVAEISEAVLSRGNDCLSFTEALLQVGMLGIWSSVQLSAQRLHFARDALVMSIGLARKLGDESLLADQLRRSAAVLEPLGAPGVAESVLREVMERCIADQNRDGVGYALVRRAALAGQSGDIDFSQRLYHAAREQLTASASPFERIAIAQGIANNYVHAGDLQGALAFLASIGASGQNYDHPQLRAAVLLTSGNIQRKMGRFTSATRSYREALENLRGLNDRGSELKVCLDLAVCLVKAGDWEGCIEVAAEVQTLLPELASQSHLQTQCELLLRELRSEHVSLERLAAIRARL